MDFPETIAAQIAGRTVRMAHLMRFDFLSGTGRYWLGFGPLKTNDNLTWKGANNMASIGEITSSVNGTAPEQTFTLSGIDASFVATATASPEEYYGRLCFVYLQFFNENWQPLDSPLAVWWGRMYSLTVSQEQADSGEGFQRTITLSAESPFASRRRPRYGYYTDRDQQSRFPGDRGCERTAGMQQKLVIFPDY